MIYTDALKILWLMVNHGIRFNYVAGNNKHSVDVRDVTKVLSALTCGGNGSMYIGDYEVCTDDCDRMPEIVLNNPWLRS